MTAYESISIKRRIFFISLLAVLLVIALLFSVSVGAKEFTLGEIINTFLGKGDEFSNLIILKVRLPRIVIASLVGICLSLSGCILQSVMRNNLASPSTIGVTSGASFMGYVLLVAMPQYAYLLPLGAFVGATFTTLFIYALAYKDGVSPIKMILSGLAVSAMLGAFSDVIKIYFSDNLSYATGFLVGGLNGVTWSNVQMVLPYASIGILACIFLPVKMNILMLGDEVANSLGINTESFRFLLIIISSLLAGASISVAGIVNFVGLIVPHISRLLVGSDYRYLFPTSILLGAFMVVVCDTIGRIIILPAEMPVGIILSVIGAPFFLYLLRKSKN